MENIDVDYKRLRLPLRSEDQLQPQQLMALSVIDKALLDSGIEKGGNVAVLVGLGTDMELYRHRERLDLKSASICRRALNYRSTKRACSKASLILERPYPIRATLGM